MRGLNVDPLEGLLTCCRAIPTYMSFHVSLGQGNPKFWTLVRGLSLSECRQLSAFLGCLVDD